MRRGRRNAQSVGQVRRRLARKIQALFDDTGYKCRVSAEDLIPNQGYWRIDHLADAWRWSGRIEMKLDPDGPWRRVGIRSWYTMTELVRSDVSLEAEFEMGAWTVEVE